MHVLTIGICLAYPPFPVCSLHTDDDETLCDLEGVVDAPFVFHGRYAQLSRGENWDAKQIWSIADDLKKTKAILQISLMPEATWWGLTKDNNCQAQAIADVSRRLAFLPLQLFSYDDPIAFDNVVANCKNSKPDQFECLASLCAW